MATATYRDLESVPARVMREQEQKVIKLARTNQSVFNRFVFGIVNQPFHEALMPAWRTSVAGIAPPRATTARCGAP